MPSAVAGTVRLEQVSSFAGCDWVVKTNSDAVRDSFRQSMPPSSTPSESTCSIRIDVSAGVTPRWAKPLFRGRENLVVAAYGPDDVMVFDLAERTVTGTVSRDFANDAAFWKRVVVPVIVGLVSPVVGIAPLHCATLVRGGLGLHISGVSGAGKSTLTAALAVRGFSVLSDDWTFFTRAGHALLASGLPVPLKLLHDGVRFFPRLQTLSPSESLNGEMAYEFDPEEVLGASRAFTCVPARLIFLQRVAHVDWCVRRVSKNEVARQFGPALDRIPDCFRDARSRQLAIIGALARYPAYLLITNRDPHETADRLRHWFDNGAHPTEDKVCEHLPAQFEVPDLMRRFAPARNVADVPDLLPESLKVHGCAQHSWTVIDDETQWHDFCWRTPRFSVVAKAQLGCLISDHVARLSILFAPPSNLIRSRYQRQIL